MWPVWCRYLFWLGAVFISNPRWTYWKVRNTVLQSVFHTSEMYQTKDKLFKRHPKKDLKEMVKI